MYKDVISARPNWQEGIDPFWKLKISDQEYYKLKDFIVENRYYLNRVRKEAALYFAEWWKREYKGGPHRKEDVAVSLSDKMDKEELFNCAKKGAERIGIEFLKGENTRYFDTLLLQGGLPLKAISTNDSDNRYQIYLTRIIRYVNSHVVYWESDEFVKNFNSYISPSFQNSVMYALTLQIVKAVQYENDSLFPFNTEDGYFQGIIHRLKETKKSSARGKDSNPFNFRWFIRSPLISPGFQYELEYVSELTSEWVQQNINNIEDDFARLQLSVEGRAVNMYVRKGTGNYVAQSKRQIVGKITNWGNAQLKVSLLSNTNMSFNMPATNSELPDISEPLVFVFRDQENGFDKWQLVNAPIKNQRNAILCPPNWGAEIESGAEVILFNTAFQWFEFDTELVIKNHSTGRSKTYTCASSLEYQVNFHVEPISWILSSNYPVICRRPIIRVFDFEENLVSANKYNISYKQRCEEDWKCFTSNCFLPTGLIDFTVEFEDGQQFKKSYFNIGDLKCHVLNASRSTGVIEWYNDQGKIVPLSAEGLIDIKQEAKNRWEYRLLGGWEKCPPGVQFEYISNLNGSKALTMEVESPFKGIILLSPSGSAIDESDSICMNALLGYRCVVLGMDQVSACINYQNNTDPSRNAGVRATFYSGASNSLAILDNDLQDLYRLNDSSILDYNSSGEYHLKIDSLTVRIEPFNADSIAVSPGVYRIVKSSGGLLNFEEPVYAIPLNTPSSEIKVVQLFQNENGFFQLGEDCRFKEIILFSRMGATAFWQVRPRYYDLNSSLSASDIDGGKRKQLHDRKIVILKDRMREATSDDDIWVAALRYFELALEYNLPFEVFNHLTAVSRDKYLKARFFVYASISSLPEDEFIAGMNCFEREFGQAWHWLAPEVWQEAVEFHVNGFDTEESIKCMIFAKLVERIIDQLSYRLYLEDKDRFKQFLRDVFSEKKFLDKVYFPSKAELQKLKQKFTCTNGISIHDYIKKLHPNIPEKFRDVYPLDPADYKMWGGLLVSPVFSALAFSGVSVFTWEEDCKRLFNNPGQRQRVLYYADLDPEWYFDIFQKVVIRMIQEKNKKK
jgi:hypothetical protein